MLTEYGWCDNRHNIPIPDCDIPVLTYYPARALCARAGWYTEYIFGWTKIFLTNRFLLLPFDIWPRVNFAIPVSFLWTSCFDGSFGIFPIVSGLSMFEPQSESGTAQVYSSPSSSSHSCCFNLQCLSFFLFNNILFPIVPLESVLPVADRFIFSSMHN